MKIVKEYIIINTYKLSTLYSKNLRSSEQGKVNYAILYGSPLNVVEL